MNPARRIAIVALLIAAILGLALSLGTWDTPVDSNDIDTAQAALGSMPVRPPVAELTGLPQRELLAALTDVCANGTSKSDGKEWPQKEIQERIKAYNALKLSLSESLSVSSSAEHLHLAALLEDDPASRIELLDRAISGSPSDPFLLWGAVQICSESDVSVNCPLQDWEQRLLEIDGQNSESWVRIAANRYKVGEYDAALDALRHASTAAESRAYWTETIEMVERGFAASSDYAFPERASMAFGFAGLALPGYGDYVTMCKEQSARDVDWAYACLAYGELLENQGKTEMGVGIGRSIQKLALEALGNLEKAAVVEQRLQASRQERLDSIGYYNPITYRLIFSNPTLFSAYLAAFESRGELAALRYLAKEIERLLEQQPQLACEPN